MTLSFPCALALLFIGLKMAGLIAWPWCYVLSPLWLPIAAVVLVLLGLWCVFVIRDAYQSRRRRRIERETNRRLAAKIRGPINPPRIPAAEYIETPRLVECPEHWLP